MLMHAFGAAFGNPDLIVAAVVGDSGDQTGPLCGVVAWGLAASSPMRGCGPAHPCLNGYQGANPPCWAAPTTRMCVQSSRGDFESISSEGMTRRVIHQRYSPRLAR